MNAPLTKAEAITVGDKATLTRMLRAELAKNCGSIPDDLKALKAWLVWEVDKLDPGRGKFAKVPVYPTTRKRRSGPQGSPSDRANLGTWEQAIGLFNLDDDIAGVGLALLPEFNLVALDVDNCLGPNGGLRAGVEGLIAGTYSEVSPSGRGIRAFWRGEARDLKNHEDGFELFHSKGFVTVTGGQWDGPPPRTPLPELTPELRETLERLCTPKGGNRERTGAPRRDDGGVVEADPLDIHENTVEDLRSALQAIPADDRDLWVRMGHALKTLPGDMGRELWLEWSQKSAKFDEEDAEEKWEGFHPTDTHFKAVFAEAQRRGWVNPLSGKKSPAPLPVARDNVTGPLPWLTAHQLLNRPPMQWLVKNVLPAHGLGVVFGESSSGKTFAIMDMALAVARGVDWRGRRVKQGGVVYVAAEGGGGLSGRLRAYQLHHGVDLATKPFATVIAGVNIRNGDAERVIDTCAAVKAEYGQGVALVVIDTLNRAMGGGDENSSVDMGLFVSNAARIADAIGGLVLIVHHSGKDQAKGARGHSSLKAAVECELEVRRDGDVRVLKATKVRDGADEVEFAFRLHMVDLGTIDEDGDVLSSCVAIEAELAEAASNRPKPVGRWQIAAHSAVAQGCATEADVLRRVEQDEIAPLPDRWRERVRDALRTLTGRGVLVEGGEGYSVR